MDDGWKDGTSSDGAKEYAQYLACISKAFLDAFKAEGFSHEDAMRLTLAIVPLGTQRPPGN